VNFGECQSLFLAYLLRVLLDVLFGAFFRPSGQVGDSGAGLEQESVQGAIGQHRVVVGFLSGDLAAPLGKEPGVGRVAHARQHGSDEKRRARRLFSD